MTALKPWLRLLALAAGPLMLAPAGAAFFGPALPESIVHLDLEVVLEPATHELQAMATFVVAGNLTFMLHESLAVRGALRMAHRLMRGRCASRGGWRVWFVPAAPGAKLRIRYGGKLPACIAL